MESEKVKVHYALVLQINGVNGWPSDQMADLVAEEHENGTCQLLDVFGVASFSYN